jgi:UDP:flavonoid glycosyltransferase YjiC (YdhE family)
MLTWYFLKWCGAGINLRTAKPSPEVLLSSVLEMITNPKYQNRAVELEKEMATYDPMSIVAQSIDELGASKV